MTRYRRLRGMAKHVLPLLRQEIPAGRALMKNAQLPQGRKGYCRWCGLPVMDKRRFLWDQDCNQQYGMVLGSPPTPSPWIKARCAECGDRPESRRGWWVLARLDIDHIYPIHQARETRDPKELVRSFLLENLQWLCEKCHLEKSSQEKRLAAERRREG